MLHDGDEVMGADVEYDLAPGCFHPLDLRQGADEEPVAWAPDALAPKPPADSIGLPHQKEQHSDQQRGDKHGQEGTQD